MRPLTSGYKIVSRGVVLNKKSIPERLAEYTLRRHRGKYSGFIGFIVYLLVFIEFVVIYIWVGRYSDMPGLRNPYRYKLWYLAVACMAILSALHEIEVIGFVKIINALKKKQME